MIWYIWLAWNVRSAAIWCSKKSFLRNLEMVLENNFFQIPTYLTTNSLKFLHVTGRRSEFGAQPLSKLKYFSVVPKAMFHYKTGHGSVCDPTKLAFYPLLLPGANPVWNCDEEVKETVSSDNMLDFSTDKNIMTEV